MEDKIVVGYAKLVVFKKALDQSAIKLPLQVTPFSSLADSRRVYRPSPLLVPK
jgi:hypothetical protein